MNRKSFLKRLIATILVMTIFIIYIPGCGMDGGGSEFNGELPNSVTNDLQNSNHISGILPIFAVSSNLLLVSPANSITNDNILVQTELGERGGMEIISRIATQSTKDNADIEFIVCDIFSPSDAIERDWSNQVAVGKYKCFLRWEYGYVGECIKKNIKHLNFQIRDCSANIDMINIHLVFWWKGGPWFGIYNSGKQRFCFNSEATNSKIKKGIENFLKSQGMPNWAAVIISTSIAFVIVDIVATLAATGGLVVVSANDSDNGQTCPPPSNIGESPAGNSGGSGNPNNVNTGNSSQTGKDDAVFLVWPGESNSPTAPEFNDNSKKPNEGFWIDYWAKNTGSTIWKKGKYYLQNNFKDKGFGNYSDHIYLDCDVKPGDVWNKRFTWNAPSKMGTYCLTCRIGKDSYTEFGSYINWNVIVQNTPPNPPVLISPSDGTKFPREQAEITFNWQAGIDPDSEPNNYPDFALRVYKENGEKVLDRGWFKETKFRWTFSPGKYTWKVAQGDGKNDTESSSRSFYISALSVPKPPIPVSPTNNQTQRGQRTYFTWLPNNSGQNLSYVISIYDVTGKQVADSTWLPSSNNDWMGPRLETGWYTYKIMVGNGDFDASSPIQKFYFVQEALPAKIDMDPSHYKSQWIDQSQYFTGYPEETFKLWVKFKNTGRAIWVKDACYEVRLAVDNTDSVTEKFLMKWVDPSWLSNNRLALPEITPVGLSEIANFKFGVKIPSGLAPGSYQFKSRLVADAITWFDYNNGGGAWWRVTLPKPKAECIGQSSYPTCRAGDNINMWVMFRNTTGYYWRKSNPAPTNLGIDKYSDESFLKRFKHSSWLSNDRIASLTKEFVQNGESTTYNFTIHVPDDLAPGEYRFCVRMVQDGYSWFDNPDTNGGAWWKIKVTR